MKCEDNMYFDLLKAFVRRMCHSSFGQYAIIVTKQVLTVWSASGVHMPDFNFKFSF